jgi:hypothetical protein
MIFSNKGFIARELFKAKTKDPFSLQSIGLGSFPKINPC